MHQTQIGSYSYTGVKPLTPAILNRNPNRDVTKVSDPSYQQTIFDKITYDLSYIDDEDDISSLTEPLQLFIVFRSNDEGALRSILQLYIINMNRSNRYLFIIIFPKEELV